MYLSRISRRPNAASQGIPLSTRADIRVAATHGLIWELFRDHAGRTRDFLFRETAEGAFMALSERLPVDPGGRFDMIHKSFDPALTTGMRLDVLLRANATANPRTSGAKRGHREDVVTRALRNARAEHGSISAEKRQEVIHEAGYRWFARKGEESGFTVAQNEFAVENTDFLTVRHGDVPMRFGVLDITAQVVVTNPQAFRAALVQGFGRSKGYGCGLMMVRQPR